MRGYAREVAFAIVYQGLINSQPLQSDFSMFDESKLTEADKQFVTELVDYVNSNVQNIDNAIAELSKAFKLDRIYRIDLSVLRLAIAEMSCQDTPKPVVINEAVGIAKKYSTPKSVSFVNGILAQYLRQQQ